MKNFLIVGLTLAFLAPSIGCGGDPLDDILTTAPAGTINGTSWTMTKATLSRDTDSVSVKLFGDDVADCAFSSATTPYIIFSVPAVVGSRELQLKLFDLSNPDNQTITFVTPPSSNNIATDGILNVTEVTDTDFTMGLDASAGDDSVNGTFSGTYCP